MCHLFIYIEKKPYKMKDKECYSLFNTIKKQCFKQTNKKLDFVYSYNTSGCNGLEKFGELNPSSGLKLLPLILMALHIYFIQGKNALPSRFKYCSPFVSYISYCTQQFGIYYMDLPGMGLASVILSPEFNHN